MALEIGFEVETQAEFFFTIISPGISSLLFFP